MAKRLINPRTSLLLAALAAAALLTACGGDKGDKASQTAAKVNKEEITVHRINFVLQRQPGLKPEQAEVVGRQVLERLIDQELAVQKAQEQKLDRDPAVVLQIEEAKREIIARAYAERVGQGVPKPTDAEIARYYGEKPALFKERRVYTLQEVNIEAKPEQVEAVRARLAASKSISEFIDFLRANDFRFSGNQAVRAAEQLPLASLDGIAKMKDGDSVLTPVPTGLTVLTLVNSRSEPVSEARARAPIEAFLLNQRRAEALQKDLKALRDSSKIEYVGKFAQPAAASASAVPVAAQAAAAEAPASAASGLDSASISKGMGLK